MTVEINYKNKSPTKAPSNLVLFIDEKFNLSTLKKHIKNTDYLFTHDGTNTRKYLNLESGVIHIMRKNLKVSSFKRWRKRVNSRVTFL